MKMIFCVLDGFLISLLGGFLISLVRMIFCVLGGDTILRSIKVKQPGLVAPPPGGDWRSEGKVAPALEGAENVASDSFCMSRIRIRVSGVVVVVGVDEIGKARGGVTGMVRHS